VHYPPTANRPGERSLAWIDATMEIPPSGKVMASKLLVIYFQDRSPRASND
jgi:hypothetical protein